MFDNPEIHPSQSLKDIRNDHLSEYLSKHTHEFDNQKAYAFEVDKVKSIVTDEQLFLKATYESVHSADDLYEYGAKSAPLLLSGKIMHENPNILDKLFKATDVAASLKLVSKQDACRNLKYSKNADNLVNFAERILEHHNVKTIPAELATKRMEAESITEVFTTIEKEQNALVDAHSNIKILAFDKKLVAKCQLAYNQREGGDYDKLKITADKALLTGAKSEEALLMTLKATSNLKETACKLDADIETHHINSTLISLTAEKQGAKTLSSLFRSMHQEEEFLVGIKDNLKYPKQHDTLLAKCAIASQQKAAPITDNQIEKLKTVAHIICSSNIHTEQYVLKEVKQSMDLKANGTNLSVKSIFQATFR